MRRGCPCHSALFACAQRGYIETMPQVEEPEEALPAQRISEETNKRLDAILAYAEERDKPQQ